MTNAAYLAVAGDGGYDDLCLWSTARWRCEGGMRAPASWFRDAGTWLRRRFARVEELPAAAWDPVTANERRSPWGDGAPTSSARTSARSGSGRRPPAPSPRAWGALQISGVRTARDA